MECNFFWIVFGHCLMNNWTKLLEMTSSYRSELFTNFQWFSLSHLSFPNEWTSTDIFFFLNVIGSSNSSAQKLILLEQLFPFAKSSVAKLMPQSRSSMKYIAEGQSGWHLIEYLISFFFSFFFLETLNHSIRKHFFQQF